jgi:CBS domain-containing protein
MTKAREIMGALPVCSANDRLLGMITDRDIVARADVASSLPDPHVGDLLEAISVG